MVELVELARSDFEAAAEAEVGYVPIEQRACWAEYEATIPGRTPWGCFRITDGNATVGFVSFLDYETHGYHYLRSAHGPMWLEQPDAAREQELLQGLATAIHKRDGKVVFARIAVKNDVACTSPTLSTVPYDQTVIIDLNGGAEDILSRMKTRGRRDVRKALRESPVTCADETERAAQSFQEYYQIMVETGERDGFVPAPISDYEDMIRILGEKHCRVFAGRTEDGTVVTWSIVTISGGRAVRYYAASRSNTMRMHVTDKLVYEECCMLHDLGCTDYDMMGIGSDFSPTLMGLNEFKCKFSKEVHEVAPDRDLVVNKGRYGLLVTAKKARTKITGH